MAEAPTPSAQGGLAAVTRKLGPLPVWAWAAVVVIGFLAYRHFHGAPSTAATTQPQQGTTDQAYVPGFDAASQTGSGGIGSTPGSVYNYYYGDSAAAQAAGGGTSNGSGNPGPTAPPPREIDRTVEQRLLQAHGTLPPVVQPFGSQPVPVVPRLGSFVAS